MIKIECKNVALGYEGQTVTENLSFTVTSGDYLCIVGENGSGKTTLMKALLQSITPISGEICFEGLSRGEVGYLPQISPAQNDFPASVREVVLSGCLSGMGRCPFYSAREKARANENMEKLGILSLAKKPYRELSGGQKQRVLLARALCQARKLLLLDEPTASLDPQISADFYSIVEKLNREENITVIMISHDIHSAMKYASHILHVGKTPLFFGKTHDYIHSGISGCFCCHEEHDHEHGEDEK